MEKYFIYDQEKYVVVDKNELTMSLRRLLTYAGENSTLILDFKGEELKVNSENSLFNINAEEILDCQNKNADELKLGIKITYLLSILGNIKGDKVKLFYKSFNTPLFIQDYENMDGSELWGCAAVALNKLDPNV